MKTIVVIALVAAIIIVVAFNFVVSFMFDKCFKKVPAKMNSLRKDIYVYKGMRAFKNKYSYEAFLFICRKCWTKPLRIGWLVTLYIVWGYPFYLVAMLLTDGIKKFWKWA